MKGWETTTVSIMGFPELRTNALKRIAAAYTQVTLGSADNDTFSYDHNTGRLTQYKFNIGATPQTVQGDLTWNVNARWPNSPSPIRSTRISGHTSGTPRWGEPPFSGNGV